MNEPQPISQTALNNSLAQGATVITGSQRLAGALRADYERHQLSQGLTVWDTPDIVPWPLWLQRSWQEQWMQSAISAVPPLLLNDQQVQLAWEQVIENSAAGSALLQVPATARRAREAADLLQAWRVSMDPETPGYNDDCAVFDGWHRDVERHYRQLHCIPASELPGGLLQGLAAGRWNPAQRLLLIGFDEFTPQQEHFLDQLQQSGVTVQWRVRTGIDGLRRRCTQVDARQEIMAAARWARARLESNPLASIGIVVPDLRSMREPVIQSLDAVLVADALHPDNWAHERPYNLSLGKPLRDFPVVQCALDCLSLLQGIVPLVTIGKLLRSPFLDGWHAEQHQRALLDAELRNLGELNLSLNTLQYWSAKEDKVYHCPALNGHLIRWQERVTRDPGRQAAGFWVDYFSALLDELGWCRGRPLSSEEFQAVEAWRTTLAELARLEPFTRAMSARQAFKHVKKLMAARTFQPQQPDVPIQVMGILETTGLQFDHLWVLGLHDAVWPAAPRPNPFLPLTLQREHGMPHAGAERELVITERITTRLLSSAGEIVVSTPLRDGDRELRVSPLLQDIPLVDESEMNLWRDELWMQRIHAAEKLETVASDLAPPVGDGPVRGGSSVFKFQAACPFRAFAELRLNAKPLEKADIGLDSRVRGSLMHQVLESVWGELKSYSTLVEMRAETLSGLLEQAVSDAIGAVQYRYPETLTARFIAVEQERLVRQVMLWLDIERQREPFVSVMPEATFETDLGGITVQVKVDRIDELPDGRKLLIDYKTGAVQPKQWFGERPEEPQLPLYSTVIDAPIAGVLFGQLQAGNLRFNGVLEEKGLVPGAPEYTRLKYTKDAPSWSTVLTRWRNTLENLGQDFRAGHAQVDPKDVVQTCCYCDLKPLCRISEHTTLDAEADEESGSDD